MPLPESFLQEIADRNDIADVVSGYVRLTKKSGSNLFGLCPFHSEKTPSFSVSAERQIYYCFGCQKGGSVIHFIMDIENLGFLDAVEFLARRSGLEMPQTDGDDRRERERMLELNREAARFFFKNLSSPPGAKAISYIKSRDISPEMVKTFGLGSAPNEWSALRDEMQKKGFSDKELFDAGLVRKGKSGGFYDTFRDRLMFPVIDIRGNVIGFSGRLLGGDDGPKYMNSPETLVFSKSRNLFAMNLAKKSKKGYIILSEGNIDVVSLHQAGFDCAVASLGTALTPEQARLISRYVNEVIIAYDSDEAGQKASARAVGILEKLDIKVKILKIKGAKDPDEFIRLKGPDAFANMLKESENHIDFALGGIISKHDLSIDEQRVAYIKESSAVLAALPNQVEREVYAMRIAQTASVSPKIVNDEVERIRKIKLSSAKKSYEKASLKVASDVQPKEKSMRYEKQRSALAEEGIIRLAINDDTLLAGTGLKGADFSSDILGRFFDVIMEKAQRGAPLSIATLGEAFTGEEISLLTAIIEKPEVLINGKKAVSDYINIIKSEKQSSLVDDAALKAYQKLRQDNKKGMVENDE